MKWPGLAESLFSVKCFAAALLALYVALRLGLPRPFWAPMTACLVSQPLAGAVRSKALYRLSGTVLGSAVAMLLVPMLASYSLLLTLALALWVALCLYVSLLDRTPRSYAFILGGYTAGLIAFPALADSASLNPATMFEVAVARVEEIALGIGSATLVHSLFFPQSIGPVILRRMDGAIADAVQWLDDTLSGAGAARNAADYHRLAQDISELRILSTHLPFDTSNLRWTAERIRALQDRLALAMPLLSGLEERLQARRRGSRLDPRYPALLHDIVGWARGQCRGSAAPGAGADVHSLRARLDALTPTIDGAAEWDAIVEVSLADDLRRLLGAFEHCFALRRDIEAVRHGAAPPAGRASAPVRTTALHVDRGLALMAALAAALAICASCAFWIFTGWPAGFAAPMLAAVFCTFFATQDDPVPSLKTAMYYTTIYSTPVAGLCLLYLLPGAHSFEMLALVLAPILLPLGVLMARPSSAPRAFPFMIAIFSTLTLNDTGSPDMTSFINGQISQTFGFIAAVLFTRLFRSVSAQWSARRVLAATHAELAQLGTTQQAPATLGVTMVDRLGLLAPRLSAPAADDSGALGDVRVGLATALLLRARARLARHAVPLQDLLQALALHYRARTTARTAAPALLHELDRVLRALCCTPSSLRQHKAVAALAGMRRDLFPHAPPYQAAPPAAAAPAGAQP